MQRANTKHRTRINRNSHPTDSHTKSHRNRIAHCFADRIAPHARAIAHLCQSCNPNARVVQ